jgi:threonine aldolase
MRQAGFAAAAALYALDHHVERLSEDHHNAQILVQAIAETPGLRLTPAEVDTNLIWVHVEQKLGSVKEVVARLKQQGVLVHGSGVRFRACTHLDVSTAQVERAAEVIRTLVGHAASYS